MSYALFVAVRRGNVTKMHVKLKKVGLSNIMIKVAFKINIASLTNVDQHLDRD